MSRIETGPVQFDDDWPGVFIRGDNAFGYALTVGQAIRALETGEKAHALVVIALKGLAATLAGAQIQEGGKNPEGLQVVRREPGESQESKP